jgi:hypothetical protein
LNLYNIVAVSHEDISLTEDQDEPVIDDQWTVSSQVSQSPELKVLSE